MKLFLLAFFFLFLSVQEIHSACGEIWFYIDDDINDNYLVIATRISPNDPLFGLNFMEVGTNLYNEVISDEIELVTTWSPYDYKLGFDYLRDEINLCWPLICEGKLEFSIYRYDDNETDGVLVFSFQIDLIHYPEPPLSFADFTFLYSSNNNSLIASTNDVYTEITNNSFVNSWELQGMDRDISRYVKNVELTNFLATGPEPNIKTIFTSATMGFPDPENFQTGEEYPPGTFAPLWRGVYYGLTVSHTTYTKNNIIYNFRNWFETENYSSSTTFRIEDQTNQFRSMFQPTHPLTVSGYFEGGSGINYQLTWHNPPLTQPWQFGTVFNAFRYDFPNFDLYSIEAVSPFQNLGTTWHFYKWNDGTTNIIKSNLQITAPTTFTAYYKGIQRSDDQNAYVNNSQRKFIRTDDNILHNVYSSQSRVWYETSGDNGVTWQLANNGQPLDNG